MQGLTADAQVLYLRLFRRYMNFDSGAVALTLGTMKRCLEYIPDKGSHLPARRVADIDNNYVRARIAELERAGLVEKVDKTSRFDTPSFRCLLASLGEVRPKYEPQANHKEGTTRGTTSDTSVTARVSDEGTTSGLTTEPQGMNHKIPGKPARRNTSSPKGDSVLAQLDITILPADLSPQVWADWCRHRKGLKRPVNTQTVVNAVAQELEKARAIGWSPDAAMSEAIAAGWQSLKAEWLANRTKGAQQTGTNRRGGFSAIDYEREAQEMGFRTEVD
jgi:hypothetical protein